jgi:hypothetical protein
MRVLGLTPFDDPDTLQRGEISASASGLAPRCPESLLFDPTRNRDHPPRVLPHELLVAALNSIEWGAAGRDGHEVAW